MMLNRYLNQWRARRDRRVAMQWAVRLDGEDCSPADQEKLERWLASHAQRHVYLQEAFRVQGMVAAALVNRSPSSTVSDPEQKHPWPFWALAASASIALAVVLIGSRNIQDTGYGQLNSVTLSDGSRIELNSDSRIRVSESAEVRQVELLEGEAYFTVVHDSKRPFVVLSEGRRITAVGTQFNVRTRENTTRVSVTEGRVVVQTTAGLLSSHPPQRKEVSGGERVICENQAIHELEADPEQLKQETAWRERRMIINNQPLAEVVEELNHYIPYKLVLVGDKSRQQIIGGVFDLDDPDRIIRVLSKRWELRRVETIPYVVVLVGS